MLQYYAMTPDYVDTPNGGRKRILGFRKRLDYPAYKTDKVYGVETLRVDLLCNRLIGTTLILDSIIDKNEKDIFSFSENEIIYVGINL